MRDSYSLYEAKAKLSAIIRRVREGRSAVVTLHGEPVAEIVPVTKPAKGIGARFEQLTERGVLVRNRAGSTPGRIAKRPGALKRFLEERNE